ncbi:MAG: HlyD family type I secretion periplasmic adaptor subunit [Rhizobiaceae bacterium]|nr:HlyD family type I secretion periplasmic adaptor subunit [Rhizobiaceae bacterium]
MKIKPPQMDTPLPASPYANAKTHPDWRDTVPTSIRKPLIAGLAVVGLFFAGFSSWAMRAPLAGAAIAPGVVIASGQNQQIGHLEGGIVRQIAVRDGDTVKQNQPLVFLDETQAQSSANRVGQSIVSLTAQEERAVAVLQDQQYLDFSSELVELAKSSGKEEVLDLQRTEFASRLSQHKSEISVLDEQVSAIEEEISGIGRQIEAEKRKLAVIVDELKAKKSLLQRGLTPKNQYNALLRAQADSEGAIGGLDATIGQRRKAISEVRERQQAIRAARRTEASAKINETRQQIADLKEQLTSRADILERMIIRAPVDGVIVNISKNTIGSVVAPGETVLEILPTSNDLIISARVKPNDVDVVRVGQEANIRFVALNTRTTPEVPATIEYVSADRLVDPVTQEPYFDARLKLDANLPESISVEQIYPGMPVDAFIKTGERTFVEYLAKPVTDSFSKAFRED